MTERAVLFTGIGGQGVQLAAQVLAHAATAAGRGVSLFGVYGGAMRGMNTDATVVVADGAVQSPPIVSRAWAAVAMHDRYFTPIAPRIEAGGLVMVNATTFTTEVDPRWSVLRVPATETARDLGNEMAAAMVIVGAFAAATGIVTLDAAIDGMRVSIPPYRQQHIELNARAIRAGAELVAADSFPAWEGATA